MLLKNVFHSKKLLLQNSVSLPPLKRLFIHFYTKREIQRQTAAPRSNRRRKIAPGDDEPLSYSICHFLVKNPFFTFFSNITFLSAFLSTFYVERFFSTSLSVFFVPPNLTPSSFLLSLPSYLKATVPNTNSGGTLERLTRKLKLSSVHLSQKKSVTKLLISKKEDG